ncbi:hypothetical protein MKW94_000578, partial [Papaver nudicaule]|nr:hypothetical protein [Papaver nudicaule]
EKESPTGEINRSLLFAETHLTKTTNDPESTSAPDVKIRKIIELVAADPDAQKDINNDDVAQEWEEVLRRLRCSLQHQVERFFASVPVFFFY